MSKSIILCIEIPSIYTDDIEKLKDIYLKDYNNESDFILSIIGEPSICRIRTEISGEKDSSIEEVWGYINEAKLVNSSKGFDSDMLTDQELDFYGYRLMDGYECERVTYDPVVNPTEGAEIEDGWN